MSKKPKPVLRTYAGADSRMRQRMRTMHGAYETNKEAFEAFNPHTFTAGFGASWLAALDRADEATPGSVRVGELQEETTDVNKVLDHAGTMAQRVFYYVGEAFPGKASKLAQYGQPRYTKASRSHPLMRSLLEIIIAKATADQVKLAEVGFSVTQLNELRAISEQLTADDTTQEDKKGLNKEDGDDYIGLQNAAFAFGQAVSKAARLIFLSDATLLARFRLGAAAGAKAEVRQLTLDAGARKAVLLTGELLPATALRLRLTAGTGPVRVLRAGTANAPATGGLLLTDHHLVKAQAADLGPAGQYVVALNETGHRVKLRLSVSSPPPVTK